MDKTVKDRQVIRNYLQLNRGLQQAMLEARREKGLKPRDPVVAAANILAVLRGNKKQCAELNRYHYFIDYNLEPCLIEAKPGCGEIDCLMALLETVVESYEKLKDETLAAVGILEEAKREHILADEMMDKAMAAVLPVVLTGKMPRAKGEAS